MKQIYTHENIMVLHSVKNILALNDIEAFVKNEHTIPNGARHGIDNIFLELWIVNDQDFTKASSIIEEQLTNPEPSENWTCTKCNEDNDGSFELCWKCQTEKASPDD
jgi:putative signal transducing protein